jgi:ABC-type multidrug transport system ATPase subunit
VPGALERVGLAGAAGERVGGFSQGMRQRVAVARTMLRQAELLLLDEPYAGLDGDAREVVDLVVLAARDTGRTVLLATHEPTRAGLATSTMLLEAGRLHPNPVPPSRSGVLG